MEFIDIPYCHLIAFFNHFSQSKLPKEMVKVRWMKGIKDGIKVRFSYVDDVEAKSLSYIQLSSEANDVVNDVIVAEPLREIAWRHFHEAREEMKIAMEKIQLNTLEEVVDNPSTLRTSINHPISQTSQPPVKVGIPPQVKTKGSGRGGRPKCGGEKRWKSDREKRGLKPRQCKQGKKYNVGHDSRNCLDKSKNIEDDTYEQGYQQSESNDDMEDEIDLYTE